LEVEAGKIEAPNYDLVPEDKTFSEGEEIISVYGQHDFAHFGHLTLIV